LLLASQVIKIDIKNPFFNGWIFKYFTIQITTYIM